MSELDDLRERVKNLKKQVGEKNEIITSLKEAENQYRMIFDNANDGIILHDLSGRIIDVNETMYKRLGYTKAQMLKMNLDNFVVPGYSDQIEERTRRLEEDGIAVFQSGDMRRDGSVISVEVSARIVDYKGKKICQSVVRDISYRKMAEDLVQSAREEKDHVVEVIRWRSQYCAWFHGQLMESLSDLKGQEVMDNLINSMYSRIQSMTFIEDKIFRSLNYARINMSVITKSLTAYLYSHCRVGVKNVQVDHQLDGISMEVKRALQCILLINELVTNALDHAFPGDNGGKIKVRITQDEQYNFALLVKDEGVGLPKGFVLEDQVSLGMKIIQELVANLNGDISITQDGGAEFIIRFK